MKNIFKNDELEIFLDTVNFMVNQSKTLKQIYGDQADDDEESQEEEFYVLRDTLAIMSLLARIDVDGELI